MLSVRQTPRSQTLVGSLQAITIINLPKADESTIQRVKVSQSVMVLGVLRCSSVDTFFWDPGLIHEFHVDSFCWDSCMKNMFARVVS